MRVVLVGVRNRNTGQSDVKLINEIIDSCKERYSHVIFVVASCDKGVGQIVKARNEKQHFADNSPFEYNCIMLELRHRLLHDLPQGEFTSHWIALNGTLVELGDEFHLLTEEVMKGGAMYDLVQRIKEKGLPCATYKPSEAENGPKKAEVLTEVV